MNDIKPAIMMVLVFTIICGGIYPAVVTGIAQAVFPKEATGSFITDRSGREIGSALIGQPFSDSKYFWPRPSATTDFGYNPAASGGSNSGPTNPDYLKTVANRVKALKDTGVSTGIPTDLVQASASGLDPHISPEAASVQIPRVAKARGMMEDKVRRLVSGHTEDRQFGIIGSPRVNVLALNLALDRLAP
ncbi:potassium-transporting ATPase, C subunit [Geobacter metallireducens RCH3]|uniref:Potassium-transporting ATPase KdpC subunit n=1 Tax=Geobacter metallireducens (strain ATCC 53774 / DSM 7210 / GS-15) TaxID=269799 RepID=KDPC_GEOMG|nr:potassium-transporting ATPase subunit KdpC [Geobacter metallireducens]Q39SW4.1 RecName: Full=Potassium-transporting ATPase KdpC subunit; AltName: Full=ATP phosphohydrolase [potassium-transporting] C chain; AltName: Full=Potassium-binding and translocating subunit C; AltName: Full=Potassium-translocating ATPase C chain [Geobacter metallireducens GS-15]ABB32660.1 potassium-transporting ATPase, C subunit [Geobacter metallireducens GS-15]EHP87847.1 potassium-transporting ATPase, C subunit [Geobac